MFASLLATALVAGWDPAPGMHRSVQSPRDVVDVLEMCRAITTSSGFDRSRLRKKRWQQLKVQAVHGAPMREVGEIWSIPDNFMMVTLDEEGGERACNASLQLRTVADIDKALSLLPVKLNDVGGDRLELDDSGQHIIVFSRRDKEPALKIRVSRPMEPNAQ